MAPLFPLTLAGRHVRLEALSLAHVDGLLAAASGPRDTYSLTHVPQSLADMRAYVEAALADAVAGRCVPFATVDAVSTRIVGSTRFGNLERWTWPSAEHSTRSPVGLDAVEIGWTWLAADAQRTAINTCAKRLMLAHAFEVWRVERVTLKTDARNLRSRAAIERIGGKLDGLLRAHMPSYEQPGAIRTSAIYSILPDEWPAARTALDTRLAR